MTPCVGRASHSCSNGELDKGSSQPLLPSRPHGECVPFSSKAGSLVIFPLQAPPKGPCLVVLPTRLGCGSGMVPPSQVGPLPAPAPRSRTVVPPTRSGAVLALLHAGDPLAVSHPDRDTGKNRTELRGHEDGPEGERILNPHTLLPTKGFIA